MNTQYTPVDVQIATEIPEYNLNTYKTSHYGIRSFTKSRNMCNTILKYATNICSSSRECKVSSWTQASQHVVRK